MLWDALLQAIAARLAGVDELVYHAVDAIARHRIASYSARSTASRRIASHRIASQRIRPSRNGE